MQTHRYAGDIEQLIRWAVNRGQSERERKTPPEPYRSWIIGLLPENCRASVGFWVGIVTPESALSGDDPKWVDRYPHRHIDSMGWPPEATTALTYLIAPEEGGEFALGGLSPTDDYELLKIEPGLTVLTDAATWHGIRRVKRGTRLALICTGIPEGTSF